MIRAISTIMAGFVLALSAVGCGAAGGEENVGDDGRPVDGKVAPAAASELAPETAALAEGRFGTNGTRDYASSSVHKPHRVSQAEGRKRLQASSDQVPCAESVTHGAPNRPPAA